MKLNNINPFQEEGVSSGINRINSSESTGIFGKFDKLKKNLLVRMSMLGLTIGSILAPGLAKGDDNIQNVIAPNQITLPYAAEFEGFGAMVMGSGSEYKSHLLTDNHGNNEETIGNPNGSLYSVFYPKLTVTSPEGDLDLFYYFGKYGYAGLSIGMQDLTDSRTSNDPKAISRFNQTPDVTGGRVAPVPTEVNNHSRQYLHIQ